MHKELLRIELKRDSYSRVIASSIGHMILVSFFLIISKNYLHFFKESVYLAIAVFIFNIVRIILTKIYFSQDHNELIGKFIDATTIFTAALWGTLFCHVYLKLGLYQAPTIALYIIVAGISSAAASSLYAQKTLLFLFLLFTIVVPGSLMIYSEIIVEDKFFGFLILTFFGFLTGQSRINRKNLIARLELSNYFSEEASRIELLFNSVPGHFCYFYNSGKILASNKSWKDFSIKFANPMDFFSGIEPEFNLVIQDFINSNDERLSKELLFRKIENNTWYICTAQKIQSTKSILLFLVDISSLKMIQEEMKQKDAHFQHSARLIELGEMVGSIAHEINNPLTIVSGRAQVSKRMIKSNIWDNEKLTANLELIELSAQRISKLVNGMKSLVRNSENDPPTNQSFDSHLEIIKFIVKNRADIRKVNLEFSINTKDLFGFCRPTQIEQVLINLINNAIDAAEETANKWVKIDISSNDNFLIFEVSDSGNGISDDLLEKIWYPFFTTKEVGKGTGLGLSISHSIIMENNGNMFYKKKGENTTFVVEIPKIKKAA